MTETMIKQAVDAAQKARREFFSDDPAVGTAIFRMFAKYNVEVNYRQHGEAPQKRRRQVHPHIAEANYARG